MAITQAQRILDLALSGHSDEEIAAELGIANTTVDAAIADLNGVPSGQRSSGLPTAVSSAPTLVSGTAVQNTTGQWATYYVAIGAHAGGSVEIDIGPDNTVAVPAVPSGTDATLAHTHTIRLPPNWWIKATIAGLATIAATQVVVD